MLESSSFSPFLPHDGAQTVPPSANFENTGNREAFRDHVSVLDYVRINKINSEVEEAVDQYYSCLEYAGRVYNTSSMPKHFSAQWLLAKVEPKRHQHLLRNVG